MKGLVEQAMATGSLDYGPELRSELTNLIEQDALNLKQQNDFLQEQFPSFMHLLDDHAAVQEDTEDNEDEPDTVEDPAPDKAQDKVEGSPGKE